LVPDDIERHRQLNAAAERAAGHDQTERKYAHLRELKRHNEIEAERRSEVADLYE
jgi:hypothetical protein